MAVPAISVVVPTCNRRPRLERVLAALERQSVPPSALEVIVVSDGSTDGTDEFLDALRPGFSFTWCRQANAGPSVARNAGVACARAEIVLFVDDDVVPGESLVEEHLRAHREGGNDVVVVGPFVMPPDHPRSPWAHWEDVKLRERYRALESGVLASSGRIFYTGNASLRRAHLAEAGGFDPAFRRGEDVELGFRLEAQGLRFLFCPRACAWHLAERTYEAWSRMARAYGEVDVAVSSRPSMAWFREALLRELGERHPLVRVLVRVCAGRDGWTRATCGVCRRLAEGAWRVGARGVALGTCSVIFNLLYYDAMAAAMEGAQ